MLILRIYDRHTLHCRLAASLMNTMNRSCEFSFCFLLISALVTSASGFSLTTPSGTVNVPFNGTITASLTASQETYALPPSPSGSNLTTLEGPSTLAEAGVSFVYNTNSSNTSTVFVDIAQTGLKNITLVQLIEVPNFVIANITDVVTPLNEVGQASSAGALIPTDVADAIYASPEKYFIQILTTTYPNGESVAFAFTRHPVAIPSWPCHAFMNSPSNASLPFKSSNFKC